MNFSSATSPELLLKTFDHYCEYRRTPNGVIMSPIQLGKWVVLFCDEINLPDTDKYGACSARSIKYKIKFQTSSSQLLFFKKNCSLFSQCFFLLTSIFYPFISPIPLLPFIWRVMEGERCLVGELSDLLVRCILSFFPQELSVLFPSCVR